MDPKWKSTEKFILLPELNLLTHYQSDKFRQCKKAGIPSGEHPKMDLVLG